MRRQSQAIWCLVWAAMDGATLLWQGTAPLALARTAGYDRSASAPGDASMAQALVTLLGGSSSADIHLCDDGGAARAGVTVHCRRPTTVAGPAASGPSPPKFSMAGGKSFMQPPFKGPPISWRNWGEEQSTSAFVLRPDFYAEVEVIWACRDRCRGTRRRIRAVDRVDQEDVVVISR